MSENNKKINRKIILLYLVGFIVIPIIIFIIFLIASIPNQFEPPFQGMYGGKGAVHNERSLLNPFICTQTFGMGDGYHEYYCSIPEFFINTIGSFVPMLIIASLWIIYLCLGLFIFLIKSFTDKNEK